MAVHEATLLLGEKAIVLSVLLENVSGLKKKDTPILSGYQLFHNYIRTHEGLEGKTPAEACGIKVEGKNKWLTFIQNASRKTTN